MRRVIGMDIHRTFAEVVFWEDGRLRWHGRVDMTRSGLEGFGRSLTKDDEVVVEATGNAMAVVRVLSPYVARVIVANPLQVKAIAHAHVKTDKVDAGTLASLHAAGFLPEIWTPDAATEPATGPPTSGFCPPGLPESGAASVSACSRTSSSVLTRSAAPFASSTHRSAAG